MSRFDYIKYDEETTYIQQVYKKKFEELESMVNNLKDGRSKSLVLTSLEEAYMWVGKALRDQQIEKNKIYQLQEERNNG